MIDDEAVESDGDHENDVDLAKISTAPMVISSDDSEVELTLVENPGTSSESPQSSKKVKRTQKTNLKLLAAVKSVDPLLPQFPAELAEQDSYATEEVDMSQLELSTVAFSNSGLLPASSEILKDFFVPRIGDLIIGMTMDGILTFTGKQMFHVKDTFGMSLYHNYLLITVALKRFYPNLIWNCTFMILFITNIA